MFHHDDPALQEIAMDLRFALSAPYEIRVTTPRRWFKRCLTTDRARASPQPQP